MMIEAGKKRLAPLRRGCSILGPSPFFPRKRDPGVFTFLRPGSVIMTSILQHSALVSASGVRSTRHARSQQLVAQLAMPAGFTGLRKINEIDGASLQGLSVGKVGVPMDAVLRIPFQMHTARVFIDIVYMQYMIFYSFCSRCHVDVIVTC
jgi:hypothetical protein